MFEPASVTINDHVTVTRDLTYTGSVLVDAQGVSGSTIIISATVNIIVDTSATFAGNGDSFRDHIEFRAGGDFIVRGRIGGAGLYT
jgi:hypothetical protein